MQNEDVTMDITIRKIQYEDIDAVSALENASFSMPWPRSAFEEIVEKEDADYFVALDEAKQIVGGLVLFIIAGDEGDITNVAVKKEFQNRGIAQKLLRYALEEGRKNGVKEFTLEVRISNAPAIRAYEKVGFVSEGVRPKFYEKPVEDGLIMWLREDA